MQFLEANPGGNEVLSQAEVERLLQQVQEQENTTLVIGPGGKKDRLKNEHVQPYDFRQPTFLAPAELRNLRLHHEEFIGSLAARLSIHLRLEVTAQMSSLQTMSFQHFTENLASPTHLTLFKAEPLKGICLLDVPPRLGLAIVDRLLGGAAQSPKVSRDLTEIEVALLDQAVQIILNEWCSHWQSFDDLGATLVGHENNGRFLQTAPLETVMLCLAMEMRVGDCLEQMQLAFPHYTIDPIVKHIGSATPAIQEMAKPAAPLRWNPELDDVPVNVTANWGGLQLTARELAALKPGDVLMLDAQMPQQVRVSVASTPKYGARLGTRGRQWAVELTHPLMT